jgi:hypothetical protein
VQRVNRRNLESADLSEWVLFLRGSPSDTLLGWALSRTDLAPRRAVQPLGRHAVGEGNLGVQLLFKIQNLCYIYFCRSDRIRDRGSAW